MANLSTVEVHFGTTSEPLTPLLVSAGRFSLLLSHLIDVGGADNANPQIGSAAVASIQPLTKSLWAETSAFAFRHPQLAPHA